MRRDLHRLFTEMHWKLKCKTIRVTRKLTDIDQRRFSFHVHSFWSVESFAHCSGKNLSIEIYSTNHDKKKTVYVSINLIIDELWKFVERKT